ncbi:unnamed protein product, partial [Ectocarpus sp. 8 AP-2014]
MKVGKTASFSLFTLSTDYTKSGQQVLSKSWIGIRNLFGDNVVETLFGECLMYRRQWSSHFSTLKPIQTVALSRQDMGSEERVQTHAGSVDRVSGVPSASFGGDGLDYLSIPTI